MKWCVVVSVLLIGGCTSMSDRIEKSPCACNYDYINRDAYMCDTAQGMYTEVNVAWLEGAMCVI